MRKLSHIAPKRWPYDRLSMIRVWDGPVRSQHKRPKRRPANRKAWFRSMRLAAMLPWQQRYLYVSTRMMAPWYSTNVQGAPYSQLFSHPGVVGIDATVAKGLTAHRLRRVTAPECNLLTAGLKQ